MPNPRDFRVRRIWRWGTYARVALPLLALSLPMVSCTRMPTAPRNEIVVHGAITGPAGEPIARTWVLFFPRESVIADTTFETYAKTDASGSYSLPLLPGDYELRIESPPGHSDWLGYGNLVRVSREHDRIDFAFQGHHVTGRLFDPTGTLVSSGYVSARIESPYLATADSPLTQGAFSFLLPSGRYSLMGEVFGAYSGIPPSTTSMVITGDTTFDFHLTSFPVDGTVIGPDGAPLDKAEVEIWPARVLSDQDGRYRIFARAGPHAVRCFPDDGAMLPRTAAVAVSGPATVNFDLRGTTWAGTVRSTGTLETRPGCEVVARTLPPDNRVAWCRTGPAGDFRLILESKRPYQLEVYRADASYNDPPELVSTFRATADTTFDLLLPPLPIP
jgi:hypothetical protein